MAGKIHGEDEGKKNHLEQNLKKKLTLQFSFLTRIVCITAVKCCTWDVKGSVCLWQPLSGEYLVHYTEW